MLRNMNMAMMRNFEIEFDRFMAVEINISDR
jgi:hypothetical protein